MPLANILNIPGSPQELAIWQTAHAAHHTDINSRIYELIKVALPEFCLDPFDPSDPNSIDQWLYNHQVIHDEVAQLLGLSALNLNDVDWQNPEQLAAWIQLNFSFHFQVANFLQVG